jgi:hypothetical protein
VRLDSDKATHYIIAPKAPALIGQLSEAVPTIKELINGDAGVMKNGRI